MARLNYNPKLEVGDRIVCILMSDNHSPIPIGTAGTVRQVVEVFGDIIYEVNWDNGSKLNMIEGIDRWVKEDEFKSRLKTNESVVLVTTKKNFLKESNVNFFEKNKDLFKFFNHRLLHQYLKALRESGITNMLGASPYFYMGKDRIEHQHYYEDFGENDQRSEAYEKVLEMADEVRDEMIRGSVNLLESQGKEIELNRVQRVIQDYSRKMLIAYTQFAGGRLNT